jgi:hypothetical protein
MIRNAIVGLVLAAGLLSGETAYAAGKGAANDYLLSLPPAGQAALLGKAVGDVCTGKTAFYMGIGIAGFAKRQALWSVKCTNGTSYAVKVNPNGATLPVECSVFLAMDGFPCFKKVQLK